MARKLLIVFCMIITLAVAANSMKSRIELDSLREKAKNFEKQQKEMADLQKEVRRCRAQIDQSMEMHSQIKDKMNLADKLLIEPGIGGVPRNNVFLTILSEKSDSIFNDLDLSLSESEEAAERLYTEQTILTSFLDRRNSLYACIPSTNPAPGAFVSSGFGYRTDPFTLKRKMHNGIDLAHTRRIPILASGDGSVAAVYRDSGYGRVVVVDHGFGFTTRYAHLSRISVETHQLVRRGEAIGSMGRSGRTTGNHLHYEVLIEGKPVNPAFFIGDL